MRHTKTTWGSPTVDPTRLTPDRVRELKQLCHPDRHAGSALSTRIFQWLSEVSKALDSPASGRR